MRVFGLLVVLTVVITLYMTRSARQTRNSDFYLRTQEALQSREYQEAAKQRDEADVHSRLKAAEEAAKKSADEKGQKFFDSVGSGGSGVEKPIGGRYLMKEQDGDEKKVVQGVATVGGRPRDKVANKEPESDEDHEVEVELNAILKKSPSTPYSRILRLALANLPCSYHLLQDILPALEESEAHPPRQVPHRPRPIRRRAGRASSRFKTTREAGRQHRKEDGPEYPHTRQEHRRR